MKTYRVLFASDLHGSNLCFSKLIQLALAEKVDALLIGGDLSGKTMTPVVEIVGGSYEAHVAGTLRKVKRGRDLEELEEDISATGSYPVRVSPAEREILKLDARLREKRFLKEIETRLQHWLELAARKLGPAGIRFLPICGNDDHAELDKLIAAHPIAENPEGGPITIADTHEVIGESNANKTPWKCPRDVTEEVLRARIEPRIEALRDPGRAIFLFHTPPINSGLDTAPALDKNQQVVMKGSEVVTIAAGSTTVRDVIERVQPLLSLHGHIHESGGFTKIGKTLCCNAGSEYWMGNLRAVLLSLDRDSVVDYHPITA